MYRLSDDQEQYLRDLCKLSSKSIEDFAVATQYSNNFIRLWLEGKSSFGVYVLNQIAAVLGKKVTLTVEDL